MRQNGAQVPHAGVVLEPIEARHAEDLQRVAEDAAVSVRAGLPHPPLPGWGLAYCLWRAREWRQGVGFSVALMHEGIVIGCAGLYDYLADDCSAEFGVWLSAAHWRRGYGRRAAAHVFAQAPEIGVRRIRARCFRSNQGALQFMLRLGFTVVEGDGDEGGEDDDAKDSEGSIVRFVRSVEQAF